MALKVGDKASDFNLLNEEGKEVTLKELLNKDALVVFFYPKDYTPGCTKEVCTFRDNYEAFNDLNVELVGISADSTSSHKSFKEKHDLPFQLLSDKGNKLRKQWGVSGSLLGLLPGRVTYLINSEGEVELIIENQFNPGAHINDTLAQLKKKVSAKV